MEENSTTIRRPVRRRKTKMEIFKEAYLPYLILLVAVILVLIFIIGALVRNSMDAKTDTPETAQITVTAPTKI